MKRMFLVVLMFGSGLFSREVPAQEFCLGVPHPFSPCATFVCTAKGWETPSVKVGATCTVGAQTGRCVAQGSGFYCAVPNLSTIEWTPIGPAPVANPGLGGNNAGRINVAVADPTNAAVIYVGTAGGGIWKTSNAFSGTNPLWQPLTDAILLPLVRHPRTSPACRWLQTHMHCLCIPRTTTSFRGSSTIRGPVCLFRTRPGARKLEPKWQRAIRPQRAKRHCRASEQSADRVFSRPRQGTF